MFGDQLLILLNVEQWNTNHTHKHFFCYGLRNKKFEDLYWEKYIFSDLCQTFYSHVEIHLLGKPNTVIIRQSIRQIVLGCVYSLWYGH